MKRFAGLALLFTISVNALIIWGVLSLATSGIKRVVNDCGKQYGIESYLVKGDLFCSK